MLVLVECVCIIWCRFFGRWQGRSGKNLLRKSKKHLTYQSQGNFVLKAMLGYFCNDSMPSLRLLPCEKNARKVAVRGLLGKEDELQDPDSSPKVFGQQVHLDFGDLATCGELQTTTCMESRKRSAGRLRAKENHYRGHCGRAEESKCGFRGLWEAYVA